MGQLRGCIPVAHGDAGKAAATGGDVATQLHAWLAQQGVNMQNVEVRKSKVGPDAGYGLYMAPKAKTLSTPRKRWWWPFGAPPDFATVASFPLSAAITAENILSDPQVGPRYGYLLDKGAVDDRTVVMAYLVVEKLKGDKSRLAPWIAALPQNFNTPMEFDEAQLSELKGTTLHRATGAMRNRLREAWGAMEPVLAAVATAEGCARAPTFEDFLWAYGVFWSRGQSLPVPLQGAASKLVAQNPREAASQLRVLEGIVPGLDFCNHTPGPQCWWEVVTPAPAAGGASGSGPQVQLKLHRGAKAVAGDELYISYGDKSNEELLMLYGFAWPGNPNDYVMLACPIPPSAQWDEVMTARMEVLTSFGMRPQFFLKSADIQKPAAGAGAEEAWAPVPAEVVEALEVFVLTPAELQSRQEALEAGRKAAQAGGAAHAALPSVLSGADLDLDAVERSHAKGGFSAGAQLDDVIKALGLRLATLSTFVRLLELKVVELEGEEGTGAQENDLAFLSASASGATSAGTAAYRKWCSTVYRAGQKGVVRAHLVGARKELKRVMAIMGDLEGVRKEAARAADMKKRK